MRLWHYNIIKYLPNTQLLLLWKTLNDIFKTRNVTFLNNYVQNYPQDDLHLYSLLVINELTKRHLEVNLDLFYIYFNISDSNTYVYEKEIKCPFIHHHNFGYFTQCFYALQEIYDRQQEDFTAEMYKKLYNVYQEYITHGMYNSLMEIEYDRRQRK